MGFVVEKSGALTTIQDLGRIGYQRYGVSPTGAVDSRSMKIANILVGNPMGEACIEATMLGPTLRFNSEGIIAITGGNLSPMINNTVIPMYFAIKVKTDDILSFGMPLTGCRAYIAFAGGLDIKSVMGSKSTDLKAKIGGFNGRKLEKGDKIEFVQNTIDKPNIIGRSVEPEDFSSHNKTVRVIMGPQEDYFTQEGINTFLSENYAVTDKSDRMGCRLQGKKIQHKNDANIVSDGICFGSIQVPDEGVPIILLSDRQTTGGYTKIATVIDVDLPKVAQCRAGDILKFEKIDIATAQKEYCEEITYLQQLENRLELKNHSKNTSNQWKYYNVMVNGKNYEVSICLEE